MEEITRNSDNQDVSAVSLL